jgi:hypothetical protein
MDDRYISEIITVLNDLATRGVVDVYELDDLVGLLNPQLQTFLFVCPKCKLFHSYTDAATDDEDCWCIGCAEAFQSEDKEN